MSSYLKMVEKAGRADEAARPALSNRQTHPATKATEATKASVPRVRGEESARDKSDKRLPNFIPLTVSEVLAEINRWGSGASKNAELYRRGELSEEKAVEYVTCAILSRRGESFEIWRHHVPAVRKALGLCIHELERKECKVCNGRVKALTEGGAR